jgi:hypothetical protein
MKARLRNQAERDRFWSCVDDSDPDGCWPWLGPISAHGYGRFYVRRDRPTDTERRWVGIPAHRVAFAEWHGSEPDVVDHVCHTLDANCRLGPDCPHRRCVRPSHLESVSNIENIRRGIVTGRTGGLTTFSLRDRCMRGHPYSQTVDYRGVGSGKRHRDCMDCRRLRAKRSYEPQMAIRPPLPPRPQKLPAIRPCEWCDGPLPRSVRRWCCYDCQELWILNDGDRDSDLVWN